MKPDQLAPIHTWLTQPLDPNVAQAIERLRRAPDVHHLAVMPDVHLASDVCIGVVLGTSRLLYPQAVGGDIGCGMLAVAFNIGTETLTDPTLAGKILAGFGRTIPTVRRHRRHSLPLPEDLASAPLSHASLESIRRDEGTLQFGTLGSGNHFIELQGDDEDRLWLMIHSGSRAMGQAIRAHHLARAEPAGSGLQALDALTEAGRRYLNDVNWARHYADANRRAMAERAAEVVRNVVGATIEWRTTITTDHNHVANETHGGQCMWVHRKGAMPAGAGVEGVLPGSMGTTSFHVTGRGCAKSLCSSAHGAGRALSREAARRSLSERDLRQQMHGVWYDFRMERHLIEEAPGAHKDIHDVLRAQRELVKVTRTLRPLLSYKGR
jgi:tRNA-splicing ligase RtcB